jgi:flavin-dependent dehydrogenase
MSAARGHQTEPSWDVIIVGGGPAGATAAALLAEHHRVLVIEKDPFPRFHIGESLLPVCVPVLRRLGLEPDPGIYLYKGGAEFVCEKTNRSAVYDFDEAIEGPPRHAWQVDRAGFDCQLEERAVRAGAEFQHGVKVTGVDLEDDRVVVQTRGSGPLTGRYLIDASGQNRLMARKLDAAEPITHFGKTAAFVHFEGLSDEAIEAIGEDHDIRIMIVDDGWGWLIPLTGRRLSVGLVSRKDEAASKLVERYIDGSKMIEKWTRGATRSEVRSERNYSFKNTRPAGSRYVCIGDSACFLDPVFSSGVSLAMVGATLVADRLGTALQEGTEGAPDLMDEHLSHMESGYRTFSAMIDRFYNTHFIEHFIFGPHGKGLIHREIVSVLAGDVWNPDNGFARMLASSRRSRQAATAAAE